MRTDLDPEGAAPLSRRAFVVGAGSTLAATTMGSAAGADDDDAPVVVAVAAPYVRVVRKAVQRLEQHAGAEFVDVREANDEPVACVRDGDADVAVTGRSVTVDDPADLVRGVIVAGWATLATHADEWRTVLSAARRRETLSTGTPVEAWSETDWDSVERVREAATDGDSSACVARTASDDEYTHLVRGTRSYQYASGRGGVGAYEVPADAVGAPSDTRRQGDGVVPLLRLAYVHADPDALDGAVSELLRSLGRQAPALDDLSTYPGPAADGELAVGPD